MSTNNVCFYGELSKIILYHQIPPVSVSLNFQLKNSTIKNHFSQLMRLWHLPHSVNSIFKRASTAIQWGYTSDFWSDPLSTSVLYVCKQEGSGETAQMRRLAWAFPGCLCGKYHNLMSWLIWEIHMKKQEVLQECNFSLSLVWEFHNQSGRTRFHQDRTQNCSSLVSTSLKNKMNLKHDTKKKKNIMTYVPSEDSDQPGHLPSLISLHWMLYG